MKDIIIKSIPHDQQRYVTLGDYWEEEKGSCGMGHHPHWEIRVSETGDWRYDMLVAIHELIEFAITTEHGVAEPDIKAFDEMFERERERGEHGTEEPGDDPRAPYRRAHEFATIIEQLVSREFQVDWHRYNDRLDQILTKRSR